MLNMLNDMVEHIEQNRNSLLMRVYGIFTIQTKKFRDLDVMVAQNCANLRNPENRLFQFDLKGSSVNRYTPFSVTDYLSHSEAFA